MRVSNEPGERPQGAAVARPGFRESFARIEEAAREVLREMGLSDEQIEAELHMPKREAGLT